ncbi:phosphatase PAP2 family protein [Streptacidiphilus sp. N1-10]|uniref:Phosphatase PAP2 family protein n=1 Tax=Streptacidiphilus jeojiensis TaxID=3229225 RepID=A0ABV6Y1B0_9ACTN
MGEPERDHEGGASVAAAMRPSGSVAPDGTTVSAEEQSLARRAWQRCWHPLRGHFHSPGRPRLWFELVLIGVSYWLYSLVRNAVPEMKNRAEQNAHDVWHLEQTLGFAWERSINHAFDSVTWLITGMNYYYATLHFIMTIGVLVWLFRTQPGRYAAARLSLFVTTAIALFGYYFYPLAPPRLMTGGDFIDTVAKHHTWGSMASGDMASVSNQFAAMPSMHIGWSLWCGLTIAFLARRRWVRAVALLYPLATLVVIVASGNHFFMDAVAGATCTGIGLLTSRLVYGRWVFAFPRTTTEPTTLTGSAPAIGAVTAPDAGANTAPETGPSADPTPGSDSDSDETELAPVAANR